MATNSECEAWIEGTWRVISVETARKYRDLVIRCIECHGPIRLHKAGPNNTPRAHAEHRPGHEGCSLGHYFNGERSPHPIQVVPPKSSLPSSSEIPEEIIAPEAFVEGATSSIMVNAYERDPRARAACIKHYGRACFICGFSFENEYGAEAAKIIHVHHIKPLSTIGGSYTVDPVKDLRPLCPNCHAVVHCRSEAYTVEEVKAMLKAR